jgi:hypothetical protein
MKIKTLFLGFILVTLFSVGGIKSVYAVDPPDATKMNTPGNPPDATKVTTPPDATRMTTPAQTYPTLGNPLKVNNLQEFLFMLVDLAITIGVVIAVLVFIWIGFQFVMAQGNDAKLKDAKNWFLYAAIGTGILISSRVIVDVIKNTFISAGVVDPKTFNK